MKKLCLVLSLLLFSLILGSISPQGKIIGSTSENLGQLNEKWEYLGQEWKNIALNNLFINSLDSFFQKINIIFVVLFSQQYSLSLKLFLIIALWIFFLLSFHKIFKYFLSFSKPLPFVISLILVIVSSHLGLFEKQVNFLMSLLFNLPKGIILILIALFIIMLSLIAILLSKFGKKASERRKKMKEEEERLKIETGAKAGEALTKAVSEI